MFNKLLITYLFLSLHVVNKTALLATSMPTPIPMVVLISIFQVLSTHSFRHWVFSSGKLSLLKVNFVTSHSERISKIKKIKGFLQIVKRLIRGADLTLSKISIIVKKLTPVPFFFEIFLLPLRFRTNMLNSGSGCLLSLL